MEGATRVGKRVGVKAAETSSVAAVDEKALEDLEGNALGHCRLCPGSAQSGWITPSSR